MAGPSLVVGYGSIGARHARLLRDLGRRPAVVSARSIDFAPAYGDLRSAVEAEDPDYVVVANDTARHFETMRALAALGYEGPLLIEKPLFERRHAIPDVPFDGIFVGYNLRFHPALLALRRHVRNQPVLAVQAYVGQYLPDWRPGTDYRASSSASAARGGGALRDLSHELDLLTWLFGSCRRLAALGGRLGSLEIDSDDAWAVLLELERCPSATLHLNYLHRPSRREILVDTQAHSYIVDLVAGSLEIDGKAESFPVDSDQTYIAQHRAVIDGGGSGACSLDEGLAALAMIEAVEAAATHGRWVTP